MLSAGLEHCSGALRRPASRRHGRQLRPLQGHAGPASRPSSIAVRDLYDSAAERHVILGVQPDRTSLRLFAGRDTGKSKRLPQPPSGYGCLSGMGLFGTIGGPRYSHICRRQTTIPAPIALGGPAGGCNRPSLDGHRALILIPRCCCVLFGVTFLNVAQDANLSVGSARGRCSDRKWARVRALGETHQPCFPPFFLFAYVLLRPAPGDYGAALGEGSGAVVIRISGSRAGRSHPEQNTLTTMGERKVPGPVPFEASR